MRTILISIFLLCILGSMSISQTAWTSLNGPWYAYDPRDIAIANNGTMYTIGGSNREIVKSTNQGDSWTHLASAEDSVYAVAVKPDDDQVIIIGLASGVVKRTTDGGSSWSTVISSGTLSARANRIVFRPNSTSFVLLGISEGADNTDHLYKSTDAGASWTAVTNFTLETTVTDIVFNPLTPDTVYVTGASVGGSAYLSEGVWRSTNGGTAWQSKITGIGSNVDIASITVDPSDRYTLYACTYSGTWKIFKNTTSGISWSATTPADATPEGRTIRAHSSSTVLIATTKGLWQTTNSGSSWGTISTSGLYDSRGQWLASYSSGGTTYYFLGVQGSFFRSTNTGVTWVDKCNGMTILPVASVAIKSRDTIYALATTGYSKSIVQRSLDSGSTWSNILGDTIPGTSTTWEGVDIAVNSSYVIVSGKKSGSTGPVVIISTNGGTDWQRVYTPAGSGAANTIGLDPNSLGTIYVAGQNTSLSPTGRVFKTTDGGQSWDPRGVTDGVFNTVIVDPANSSVLYTGGTSVGVYKSTNAGSSWSSSSTGLPGSSTVNALAINPITGLTDTLYAGTTGNGVYRSVDAGANWTQLASTSGKTVNYLLLHPINTSVLYATGIDGSTPFISKLWMASSSTVDYLNNAEYGLPADATINKIVNNPFVKYKLLLATSDGVYKRFHQWAGQSETNFVWNPGDSIQIGQTRIIEGEDWSGGSLSILDGDTLTMQPGSRVSFLMSPDNSDGALSVYGVINAIGLANNKIYFQPYDLSFVGGNLYIYGKAVLKYCDFYRMTRGTSFENATGERVDYSTYRDCMVGISYGVDLPSPAIVAKKNSIRDCIDGIFSYYSDIGIDSCDISHNRRGIYITGGSPGFRNNTIDSNSNYGVYCTDGASPKFGGYLGTERGYNYIAVNNFAGVYANASSPFFGDETSGGFNSIFDFINGYRIEASNSSTIDAQYTSWGDTCTPSSGLFSLSGGATVDYTNSLPINFNPVAPSDGATGVLRNTQFIWNTSFGSHNLFRLQIATDNLFTGGSIVFDLNNITDTTYTKPAPLNANTTYYWRVYSIRSNGYPSFSYSCWTDIRSFTTGTSKLAMDDEQFADEPLPTEYQLTQNFPNPFNPVTEIRYALPEDQFVTLTVYDMLGRELMELVNEHQSAGYKIVRFDAGELPSGVYIYRLQAGKFSDVKKMLFTK